MIHLLKEELDVGERIGEDLVEHELTTAPRVDGVVHGAHVQGSHLRRNVPDVSDPVLARDPKGTGREVDDHVGPRADLGKYGAEGADRPVRIALRSAGMDMDDGRTSFGCAARFLADLHRRVRDRRAETALGQYPCERRAHHHLRHHGAAARPLLSELS